MQGSPNPEETAEDGKAHWRRPQIPFAVFSLPDQPDLHDVLRAFCSFRELVPLARGASLYRHGDGFIVRTPAVTSYVDYFMDVLEQAPVADATGDDERVPGIVEIPITDSVDPGGVGTDDWVVYPSHECGHQLHIAGIGMCLSPVVSGDSRHQPNASLYRSGMYTLGGASPHIQELLHLLWRYVDTSRGTLLALINRHRSGYYQSSIRPWIFYLVYVAAIIRSEQGTKLVAPVPVPSTDLVHLWMSHGDNH